MYQAKGNAKAKKYEIDFLIVKKKKICIIEVKSSSYMAHKSIDYFLEKYAPKSEERYIVYTKNYKIDGQITYLPIYMTFCLGEQI